MNSQFRKKEKSAKDVEKEVIQTFSHHGFMLRPATLKTCLSFLYSAYQQDSDPSVFMTPLKDIINNLRVLYTNNLELSSTNFVEENAMEEAIKLYQNKVLNPGSQFKNYEKNGMEEEHGNQYGDENMDPQIKKDNSIASEEEIIGDLITRKLATSIVILNAYTDFPNLVYDKNKQTFVQADKPPQIFTSPEQKALTFKQRFTLVREKMMKSKDYIFPFQNHVHTANQKVTIVSEVGSLLGNKGDKNVLGILFQGENNQYYIQDLNAKMMVKFDAGAYAGTKGFFLNNQIVIAHGYFYNDIFHIKGLSQPEINQEAADKYFLNKDYFGAHTKVNKVLGHLLSLEMGNFDSKNPNNSQPADKKKLLDKIYSSFIAKQKSIGIFDLNLDKNFVNTNFEELTVFVLSNFHIDKKEVIQKFRQILEKCESVKPLMFILMGELSSNHKIDTEEEFEELNQNIDSFIELLEEFPTFMKSCFWIFIPAPNEFGMDCMPLRKYPSTITERLEKKIPLFINGSNPLKLSVLNRKIVILRKDLLKEMRRNSIIKVEEGEMHHHVVHSVISQSHLMPLSVYSQPILWDYDFVFRIFKLPDIVILADGFCSEYDSVVYNKTSVVNPGNFYRDGTFLMIRPVSNDIVASKVSNSHNYE